MNRLKNVSKVALMVFAVFMLASVPLRAQGTSKSTEAAKPAKAFTGEIWDSVNAERGSRDQMMKENSLTTPLQCTLFAMHYLKPPAKYVLYDAATKKIYQLDDQDRVQPYAAEKVKVMGTYDEATHTIHVTGIESNSSPSPKS